MPGELGQRNDDFDAMSFQHNNFQQSRKQVKVTIVSQTDLLDEQLNKDSFIGMRKKMTE